MDLVFAPSEIETWPIERLRPNARNAKTHGFDQIAGHGRILTDAQLGLKEASVIVLGHLTEALHRAYRIGDIRLTELSGWDEALLLEELRGLLAEDVDLGLIGIPKDELDALLANANDRPAISDDDADVIPEPPTEPITKLGDIWVLGMRRCARPNHYEIA